MQKRWYIAKVEYPKTFGFESHHWSRGRNAALHFQGIRQPFPASPRVVATSKQKVTDNVQQCITYRFPRQQRNQSAPKSSNFCSQSLDKPRGSRFRAMGSYWRGAFSLAILMMDGFRVEGQKTTEMQER